MRQLSGSMLKRASQSARLHQVSKGLKYGVSRASQSARLAPRQVGRGLKHGVSHLKKIRKRRSISEPNLVVCIDGKGDRLGPSEKRAKEKKVMASDLSDTRSYTESSNEHDSHSEGDTVDSARDIVSAFVAD